jgi:hypothetical protein
MELGIIKVDCYNDSQILLTGTTRENYKELVEIWINYKRGHLHDEIQEIENESGSIALDFSAVIMIVFELEV